MATEDKQEELKMTETATGELLVGDPPEDEQKDDERLAKTEDESHSDDEQGHAEETEEEAEARRIRNRTRRAENKERRKDYIDSLKREIAARDELLQNALQRIDAVERRGQGADVAALDSEIKKTADAYNYFKNQIQLGTQEQNGAVVADATEKMIQSQRRYEQLTHLKQAATKQQAQPVQQPLDPRLKMQAEKWLEQNSWYDVEGRDEDSFLVKQLDGRLAAEGWNPTTEAYWRELDARVKKYLPHRVNSGYNKSTMSQNKSPVAGSGRAEAGNKGTGSYRLSAERVQALKDSGLYDDPKARADAIRRYQEYDRQAAGN